MLFNCFVCAVPEQLVYKCQIEAVSIDLAVIKFSKMENFKPTHIRVRPQCRIAFKEGIQWFLFVSEHGQDPKQVYERIRARR